MTDNRLRSMLDRGDFILAPGVHDMMSAMIATKIGFDVIYGSGYWLMASCHGLPDAGIATYTQMLERVSTLKRTSGAALIADADTGYGGLLNVHTTVQGYEAAGVSGIQIEDQEFPKKCGHTPHRRCIPISQMATKIRVACDARKDQTNTLIIARTDCRQSEGLDAVLRRGEAYAEAGADLLFLEALETEEEMRTVCERLDHPLLANMADGGNSPILPVSTLKEIGFSAAIFPATTSLAANYAVEKALRTLKETGTSQSPNVPLFDFREFCRLIGFEEVWAFEKKWISDE